MRLTGEMHVSAVEPRDAQLGVGDHALAGVGEGQTAGS